MQGQWIDCGKYYEFTAPQHLPDGTANSYWKEVRKGRITGTGCSKMTGRSRFSPNIAFNGKVIAGVAEETFTPEALARMKHGNDMEEFVRILYEQRHPGIKVKERGFIVPKFDMNIGYSPDGDVQTSLGGQGLLEIKCPQKMYQPLIDYMNNPNRNPNSFEHIWDTHYDQMQWGMGIMERNWCDYMVYDSYSKMLFEQRIPYNHGHFTWIYQENRKARTEYVVPYLQNTNYPILPEVLG